MPRGSKPGERRGGRKVGTPNKQTAIRIVAARQGLALAERFERTPLELILSAMSGGAEAEKITDRQLQCAIAAAPYVHPRLSAVAHIPPRDTTDDGHQQALACLTYEERKEIERMLVAAKRRIHGPEIKG